MTYEEREDALADFGHEVAAGLITSAEAVAIVDQIYLCGHPSADGHYHDHDCARCRIEKWSTPSGRPIVC